MRDWAWFSRHWIAWIVLAGLVAAGLAAASVTPPAPAPGWSLRSSLVYRIEFAGVLLVAGYIVLIALRLGWHNQTFSRVSVGPASAEAPTERAAADELTSLQQTIERLAQETSDAIEELTARVEALESRHENAGPEVS